MARRSKLQEEPFRAAPAVASAAPDPASREPEAPAESAAEASVPRSELFRGEAVEEYLRDRDSRGLLRISPRWADWTYRCLLAMFVGSILFCIFGRVNEYATGPAIVRMAGHAELTARAPGTVEEVIVVPGERVEEGQLLVRFYAGVEERERDRAREEFELQLLRLLRDPLDEEARTDAAAIRPQLVLAQARLEERNVLAPHRGVVSDIRIRPGQLLAAGETVLTLVQENRELDLLAFVPGRHRPLLEPGMPLRLEVTGYSHAYLDLEVLEVGDEVVGPSAVKRFLGTDVGDAVPVAGSVVVLHAALPQRTFRADGRDHEFFAGMQGVAAVRVRRESVAVALVPGFRGFLERFRN